MRTAVLALLAVGCVDGHTGGPGPDTAVDDGCADGTSQARAASMQITTLIIDGLAYTAGFDADLAWDGVPSACVDSAGLATELRFGAGTDHLGTLRHEVPSDGTFDLNGSVGKLEIELVGAPEPFTVSLGDWTTGTWYVSSTGALHELQLTGESLADGHSLAVTLFAAVER